MQNEFREVERFNGETGKREVFAVGPDGKYYGEDGKVYEQNEINTPENPVAPVSTSEEKFQEQAEEALDDRDKMNSYTPPINRRDPDPPGQWMNQSDDSMSAYAYRERSINTNGEPVTIKHEYGVVHDNTPGEDGLLGPYDEVIAYRRTSTVDFPNPNDPLAFNEHEFKFGSGRLPRGSLSNPSIYQGHAYLAEVCSKAKFVEQCANVGVGGEGIESGKDGSKSISYPIVKVPLIGGIGGTTTVTGEATEVVEAAATETAQETKQKFQEMSQETKQKLHQLQDDPRQASWIEVISGGFGSGVFDGL